MSTQHPRRVYKGRGARTNPPNRYSDCTSENIDDGWGSLEETLSDTPATTLSIDTSRKVITYNDSPDVGFDRSINPYRGCEHGCAYCFARPTHAWLGLSPGLDFETRLFWKPEAPTQLERELAARNYRCAPVAVGINTDAYQPCERKLGLTRALLEILVGTQHPFSIVTKSALIERDIELIATAAARHQASVCISLTTLDNTLARHLEPRAPTPTRRLETIRALSAAGIPVTVLVAPLIPVLADHELESLLEQARSSGAQGAGYILLRLPHELKELFRDWLETHAPLKASHVMNRLRDCRGGKDYDARFGTRMRGTGIYAELLRKRFRLASRQLGYKDLPALDSSKFISPAGSQISLF